MKILFLLVARGGSKGIKHKNLSKIGNRTLIALKTLGCLKSKFCDEVIISTDDKKIAEEAIKNGAKQYFWRPDKYSSDDSSINDVISHALKELEFNFNKIYDYIMLLEPSSPFTRPKDYDIAISIMKEKKMDLVVSVVKHKLDPMVIGNLGSKNSLMPIINNLKKKENLNRQNMALNYTPNGCLYLFSKEHFVNNRKIYSPTSKSYAHIMPEPYSVEIDEPIDLEWANFLYESKLINFEFWS